MQMKSFRRWRSSGSLFFGGLAIDAACHRLQELARVLEVAPPQDRSAFACEVVGGVGRHRVVADDDAFRRGRAALGTPTCRAYVASLFPADLRGVAQDEISLSMMRRFGGELGKLDETAFGSCGIEERDAATGMADARHLID